MYYQHKALKIAFEQELNKPFPENWGSLSTEEKRALFDGIGLEPEKVYSFISSQAKRIFEEQFFDEHWKLLAQQQVSDLFLTEELPCNWRELNLEEKITFLEEKASDDYQGWNGRDLLKDIDRLAAVMMKFADQCVIAYVKQDTFKIESI